METQTNKRCNLRILAIDDDPFVLALTVHILQHLGFREVTTASDGAAALGMIKAAEPSFELVICDLNMPVMDGYEFMRAAGETGYQGALIVLSSETPGALAAAVELGKQCGLNVLGALGKPLDPERLLAMLNQFET